jgi:hypothetical protein
MARTPPNCGTEAGYARHLALGTPTCDACKTSNNRRKREWMTGRLRRDEYVVAYKPRGLEWMFTPSEWAQQARCAGEDPELWFSIIPTDQALAVQICKQCPVQAACLSEALKSNAEGIWGGLTEAQIDDLKRKRRRSA